MPTQEELLKMVYERAMQNKYKPEDRQVIVDENTQDASGPSFGAGLAALGAGLQGRDAASAGMNVLNQDEKRRQDKLTNFDTLAKTEEANQSKLFELLSKKQEMANKIRSEQDLAREKLAEQGMQSQKDREAKIEAARIAAQGRADSTKSANETKQALIQQKADELSVPQGKQKGLLEIGLEAEKQYRDATADPDDYNPSQNFQFIDNSEIAPNFLKNDKAIAAQAAQSAWVESFLRDASGAAIPPSERMAYAKDFFPQPGDPAGVRGNKEKLRIQKMENARISAGGDKKVPRPDYEKLGGKRKEVKRQYSPSTKKTKIIYDDGSFEVTDGQ